MARSTKPRREIIIFWLATYPLNVLLGLIFSFLRLIGLIRIIHPERIPRESGSFIIAPNHRSYWEPILMPGIFFPWSMLQPLRRVPWCALDPKGFESWWIFKALRPRFVLVRRESRREMVVALLRMIDVLREGDRLILYAEGTRLYKAKEVRVAPSGNRLGKLQSGITTLVQQTSAPILPVWVDGSDRIMPPGARFPRFWRPMTLVIGEPLYFEKPATFKEENGFITETLSTALLALAEEIP